MVLVALLKKWEEVEEEEEAGKELEDSISVDALL